MANKRELKKSIRNTCGALALEMIQACETFPEIGADAVRDVVLDSARLQIRTIGHVGVGFDRTPSQFETLADYNKARRSFYKQAYGKLRSDFSTGVDEIVKKMNASVPQAARDAIKEALN